jgi:hypothetical protein
MMDVYFKTIEGQTPNPEWDQKLSSASDKFRELSQKAASYVSDSFSANTTASAAADTQAAKPVGGTSADTAP